MKQCIAAYSNFDAPSDGLGCFDALFDYGKDAALLATLDHVDALLLWGGADISPSLYKEHRYFNSGPTEPTPRDVFEWSLITEAVKNKKPIIGVCRGAQLLCAYAGGKLVQDVSGHQISHKITTHDGKNFLVNSYHHQMLYPYDVEHELLAFSTIKQSTRYEPEGEEYTSMMRKPSFEEAEVVYFPEINGFAIQCHPEWHTKDTPFNQWVLEQIISFCFKG